ncbi:MAG: hypothetical protein IPJ65_17065 [Archangiaceae bacterium]|nr:hypothetical protein [Archangiaceae bacterium]
MSGWGAASPKTPLAKLRAAITAASIATASHAQVLGSLVSPRMNKLPAADNPATDNR